MLKVSLVCDHRPHQLSLKGDRLTYLNWQRCRDGDCAFVIARRRMGRLPEGQYTFQQG